MSFTKGPWRVAEASNGYFVAYGSNPITPPEFLSKEDAHLIAQAPRMYAALEIALETIRQDIKDIGPCDHSVGMCICGLICLAEEIEDILKKARGEE